MQKERFLKSKHLKVASLATVVFLLSACTTKNDGTAKISIQVPNTISSQSESKVGTLSATPLVHLAINVSGPGIAEPKFYEADANRSGSSASELPSNIEVIVPAGSNRLIQVLAVYQNSVDNSMLVKYGDRVTNITVGVNQVQLLVNDIVSGFRVGKISGRYLTGSTPFDSGPTGRLDVKFPVGNGRPDMIVERVGIYNGWFTALASGNVGFKYVVNNGFSLFDSLNLSALVGTNFIAANFNWFKIAAPNIVYVPDNAVWKADSGRDLLTGFFAPEGMDSIINTRRVCRPSSYNFTKIATDSIGSPATFNMISGGTLNGLGGDTSTSSSCMYGGPMNRERMWSNFIFVEGQQLEGNHGDSFGGMRGVFGNTRDTSDIVKLNGPYSAVAAAGSHTCAIQSNGELYCWGNNVGWQLGDGTSINRTSPTLIDSGTAYTSISAAQSHTCGISTAGNLKCWGRNDYGEIGVGTSGNYYASPQLIGSTALKVSTSQTSTCAIFSGGVLKCWGSNTFGNLGDATTTNRTTPVIIDSGVSYVEVSAGTYHTCGITSAGALKCWGTNSVGQLGDGTTTVRLSPAIIDVGTAYTKIFVSTNRTCGITSVGNVKCWGGNSFGHLGDGTQTDRLLPTPIASGRSYLSLSLGQSHTCGLSVDKKVICWGYATYGGSGQARGDYSSDFLILPAIVYDGLFDFTTLSGGDGHTCGLSTANALICWGTNADAQLGMNTPPSDISNVRRLEVDDMKAIVLRPLPGLMQGDMYGGTYFNGVALFKKENAQNENIDNVDCSAPFLAERGYSLQTNPIHYESLTRSITIRFGNAWAPNDTTYVICPTKNGALVQGGMTFR